MPRLVHLFAMPLVPDSSVTYQWLRELRRWHGEKMLAVHFVLPSDEEVLVGRYNTAHARLPVRDAIRSVLKSPAGNELIVLRSVPRREVVGIRSVTQLVGWTGVPEASAKLDCICQVCVPAGARNLMRRVRAEFSRRLVEARNAKSDAAAITALRRLDTPLERARGKMAPDKPIAFSKAENAEVRRAVGWLFGFIDHQQCGRDVAVSARLLAAIAASDDEKIRARTAEAAARLLRDDDLGRQTRERLQAIVAIRPV